MNWFSPWLAGHVDTIVLWVGALGTLGLYSILYRENKIYRLFEHIFLGLATGYMVASLWNETLRPKWWQPMWDKGNWWLIFALFTGLFYYFIYSRKLNWLSRLVIGFFLGIASGRAFQEFINDTWKQVPSTFKPLLPHPEVKDAAGKILYKAVSVPDVLNNLIFLIIVVCVMSYFFFSFEHKSRLMKGTAQSGRWLMMFTFGAIFGATIMGRLALLIDRVDFLLNDFGPQIGGKLVMFGVLMALAALVVTLVTRQSARPEETDAEV